MNTVARNGFVVRARSSSGRRLVTFELTTRALACGGFQPDEQQIPTELLGRLLVQNDPLLDDQKLED